VPSVSNSDLTNIFNASVAILAPYSTSGVIMVEVSYILRRRLENS